MSLLLIDDCRADLDSAYRYVAVYSHATGDPERTSRLRLLYDRVDHTGDEMHNGDWTEHWACFASRINDHWSGLGGYNIIAAHALDDLPEVATDSELGSLPHESAQPRVEQASA